ncbi:hypothetical protein GCM10023148_32370 [Actinokineospora soli]
MVATATAPAKAAVTATVRTTRARIPLIDPLLDCDPDHGWCRRGNSVFGLVERDIR